MSNVSIIEIKAKCAEPQLIHDLLKEKSADYKGCDHQIDTYFNCNDGRLKLRTGSIENTLIAYSRPNQEGPKLSDVHFERLPKDNRFRNILASACGVLVEVDKKRHIYFLNNVKFHIDEVKDLGSFMEIEAIDESGEIGVDKLQEQCDFYMDYLQVKRDDLIDCSYSDLLLKQRP